MHCGSGVEIDADCGMHCGSGVEIEPDCGMHCGSGVEIEPDHAMHCVWGVEIDADCGMHCGSGVEIDADADGYGPPRGLGEPDDACLLPSWTEFGSNPRNTSSLTEWAAGDGWERSSCDDDATQVHCA